MPAGERYIPAGGIPTQDVYLAGDRVGADRMVPGPGSEAEEGAQKHQRKGYAKPDYQERDEGAEGNRAGRLVAPEMVVEGTGLVT